MFHSIAPILTALNIQTTNSFYKDKLEFDTAYVGNYLIVSKENIKIYFIENKNKLTFQTSSCYISVSNIEDLYVKFSKMEMINPVGRLEEKPWKMKEFYITDNNGNQLNFGEVH